MEILRRNNLKKSRYKRHFYLLRNLLWAQVGSRRYRMLGSTPTGRSRRYSYYITRAKPNGKSIRIPCELVDVRIPNWLRGIAIEPGLFPAIQQVYQSQVEQVSEEDRDIKLAELERRITQLREEELSLGRLFITRMLSEDAYDQLRSEWQERPRNAEIDLAELKRDVTRHLDDLDAALSLMGFLPELFERLEKKDRSVLLQIIAKRIGINTEGEIVDQELQSPFAYLSSLAKHCSTLSDEGCGSDQFRLGSPNRIHPKPHSLAVEQFLAMVRFEHRAKLAELPDELVRGRDVFS